MKYTVLFLAFLGLLGVANAQDAANDTQPAAHSAQLGAAQAAVQHTIPQIAAADLLDFALSEAEAAPKLKFNYTMTFDWPDAKKATVYTIVSRFDAKTRKWSILSGDVSALPRPAKEKFRNMQKSESTPGGLLYADFRKYLKAITLDTDEETQVTYKFLPPEADGKEITPETDAAMRARLYVDKAGQYLARYEVRALAPVKPLPGVKLENFVVEQDFERIGDDGPAVLVRLYSKSKGRRFLKKVDTEFTARFSDFELVD